MHSFLDAKTMAKALRQGLAERDVTLSHSDCLELVARQFGFAEWNMLAARIEAHRLPPLAMPDGWFVSHPSPSITGSGSIPMSPALPSLPRCPTR
jgi:hypothetical protein